jgi:hypothetical protein
MRRKWDEQKIAGEIMEAIHYLNSSNMPSRSDLEECGYGYLATAITKYGGYKYFADKLGLEQKQSATMTGDINEEYIYELLYDRGYKVEFTPPRHPYDLLVNGVVRIDVKSANPTPSKVKRMNEFVFAINNYFPKCDIFVFVKILGEEKKEVFIIPSNLIKQSQLGIGETSKYDCFKDRFDYIDTYTKLFEKVV